MAAGNWCAQYKRWADARAVVAGANGGGQARAHAIGRIGAQNHRRAGFAQAVREQRRARAHDGEDVGNRCAQIGERSQCNRRLIVERMQQLVGAEAFRRSCGEQNAANVRGH